MITVPDQIVKVIQDRQSFIGHVHIRPDADSVGSMLALSLGLEQLGKSLSLYCEDSLPRSFDFFPQISRIEKGGLNKVQATHDPAYIFVDTAKWQMATHNDVLPNYPQPIINIDHHPDNCVNANFSWIDSSATSATQMIYELLKVLKVEITKDIATCLIAGLFSDTYAFRNQNTDSGAFQTAAELLDLRADYQKCVLYLSRSKSVESIKTLGLAAQSLKLSPSGQFSYIAISYEDWQKIGSGSIGEIANELLSSVEGTLFGAILAEKEPQITKGSIRAREAGIDVSKIAQHLGGGGHEAASGFMVPKSSAKATEDFLLACQKSGYN